MQKAKKLSLNKVGKNVQLQAIKTMQRMLPKPLLTRDQVELLKYDNVVSGNYPSLKDLNIAGETIQNILPTYIYRFRSGGQFG